MLLFLAAEYSNASGKLVLFNVPIAHGEIYEMARLEASIEIYSAELDAINSFFPDRAIKTFDILSFVEQMKKDG